jgi:hypothetical protein
LYYTTSTLGVRFVTEETLDTTSERYTKWVDTLTKFEKALSDTSSDDYLQYIDVDTFVDMYIVNELFQTVDFGYSSVKFYITYDESGAPTIHAGPLWDFDLSSGNSSFADVRTYNTMRCQNVNTWFGYLMKNTTFKNKVIEKFKRYQPVIQNIYKSNQLGDSQINKNVALMQQSRIRNYSSASEGGAGWSETVADSAEYSVYPYSYSTVSPYSSYTYDQHVEYLETWLENRNKYLCEAWNIDYDDAGSKAMEYISDDLAITGYQISTSYEGTDGSMGFRTVYQTEPKVEGQTPTEVGIVYGLVYGDNPITKSDVLYGSDNEYVASYSATENGIINEVMGDSKTANYYARTMEVSDQLSTDSLTVQYYIRAYAILPDGTVEYSNVKSYTVFKVADYVYQNNLVSRESSFNYIYSKILARVDSGYVQKDFDWGNTIVK